MIPHDKVFAISEPGRIIDPAAQARHMMRGIVVAISRAWAGLRREFLKGLETALSLH